MKKEIKKIKDTTIECPICRSKIKIALPIFMEEYHEDMYITHEMEYRERKRLEKKVTNLQKENQRLKEDIGNYIEEEKKIPEKIPLNYADDRKPEEVYEYLRCSYNQLIDYLKSKGE